MYMKTCIGCNVFIVEVFVSYILYPVEDGTCYDTNRSVVTSGGTFFSRAWLGDRSDGAVSTQESTVTEVRDRLPSGTPDLTGDLGGKTGIPLSGFSKPITGDICSVHMDPRSQTIPKLETNRPQKRRTPQLASVAGPKYPYMPTGIMGLLSGFGKLITSDIRSLLMDAPIPDDTEVGDRLPSETPDLMNGLGGKTKIPLSGFGKPITGDIRSLRMDAPIPDNTEFGDRLPSETPDLMDGLGGKTEIPLSGFGKPITGDIPSLCMDTPRPDNRS